MQARDKYRVNNNNQGPKLEIGLLLRSAAMVNLDPMQVPGDANPWTWQDPRAQGWRSAIRAMDPVVADAAEAAWGPAMSLGLRAALAGESEWTADLVKELAIRRPGLHAERRDAALDAALQQIAQARQAERETRAASTPTPEQLQAQLIASRNQAAAQQARLHSGME
jgi:hypothetical protein